MRFVILVACFWLATSPLQSKMVFTSKRDGNPEIYTMANDGSNQTRLTFNEASDSAPAWSPNGQQIVFDSTRDGNREIYVMDADGSNQRNLTRHPAFDVAPDWHPDGDRIAFMRGEEIAYIYTIDLDGNNLTLITKADYVGTPRWSPDGKRIAFEAFFDNVNNDGNHGGIYVADANGRNRWLVSREGDWEFIKMGGWSPDGQQIMYKESRERGQNGDWVNTIVIATLHRSKREVIGFDEVKLPPSPLLGAQAYGWGADGKSIIMSGIIGIWNVYRYRLADRQLIQLTDTPPSDNYGPDEWNPRLSVPPKPGRLPVYWGEMKAAQ